MPRTTDEDPAFTLYLSHLENVRPLSRELEIEVARRAVAGDRRAIHELVVANLRFVVGMAMKYRGYGLRLADLVEEGNLGLLVALRKYDPERGLRFITYAAYWIRAFMLQYVLRSFSMVGVGSSPLQHKLFFRLQRERARLAAQGGDSEVSSTEALAGHFQTSAARIDDMAGRLDHRDLSLDVAYGDGASPMDFLRDEGVDQETRLYQSERDDLVRERLRKVLGDLSQRECYIVQNRMLNDEDERLTLAEIGKNLGISRERVRQLEDRLRAKLRQRFSDLATLQAAA